MSRETLPDVISNQDTLVGERPDLDAVRGSACRHRSVIGSGPEVGTIAEWCNTNGHGCDDAQGEGRDGKGEGKDHRANRGTRQEQQGWQGQGQGA